MKESTKLKLSPKFLWWIYNTIVGRIDIWLGSLVGISVCEAQLQKTRQNPEKYFYRYIGITRALKSTDSLLNIYQIVAVIITATL